MKKFVSTLVLAAFVFGAVGIVTVATTAKPTQAMSWGELKCMYLPSCAAALKALREAGDKGAE